MARYKIILAYDGSRFKGSQRQAQKRTVQGELEKALRTIGWKGRTILMAGRTDSGVHASGQVAALDLEWRHSDQDLVRALNRSLPGDVAVRGAVIEADTFHPRFDAKSRMYRYRLFTDGIRDPLHERTAWRVWPEIDGELLVKSSDVLCGKHDFAAFGSPLSSEGTTVRTVTESTWVREGGEWAYEIQADAFLYRMVRRLVFVQVAAAQGRCSVEAIARALSRRGPQTGKDSKQPLPAGLAPAHGLTLVEVGY